MRRKALGIAAKALGVALGVTLLAACAFTLSDINTGVTAGRTFEDGSVFASGKTAWSATVSGHFTRDKR